MWHQIIVKMDAVLFIVHGTQILFKYDPHNLSKDSHLLLPILVSQQVLAFEEEEEISEIKLNDGRVMSLKFYQHHGGQYQVRGVSYITANIYCKSRNLPNTDIQNYSIDLR